MVSISITGSGRLSVNFDPSFHFGPVIIPVQNLSGLCGNNGLSGLQNLPCVSARQDQLALWFLLGSVAALGLGYLFISFIVGEKFGLVIRAIRDNEVLLRFLGYQVEHY